MIPIPVCFLPEMLAGKSEKDHGPPAYFNKLRFVVKDLKILKICGQKICGRSFVVRSFVVRSEVLWSGGTGTLLELVNLPPHF
jgi:hypothetical protein